VAAHWDDLALLQLIGCITSVRRLRDFLLAEEVDPRFYERMLADEVCLPAAPAPRSFKCLTFVIESTLFPGPME
jgi:hypothetical protein